MTKEEIRELIKAADIRKYWKDSSKIQVFNSNFTKDSRNVELIKSAKQEILAYLDEQEAEENARREDRKRRIREIEGLTEIENAKSAINRWYDKFNASFEGENACGGMGCGSKPDYDFEAAYKKYPRAAAYLECEEYAHKSNWELSAIGKEALEEVIYGDYEKALKMLEEGRNEFCMKHAWD